MSSLPVRGATGTVLTAPDVNSINTYDLPDVVVPKVINGTVRGGNVRVLLPAKSVAVLVLEE